MVASSRKDVIKNIIGQIPFTAEVYWLVRQGGKPIHSRFSLKGLNAELPEMVRIAQDAKQGAPAGKKIFIFASLHYWIEHAALMGVALSALGHRVSFGFLPYSDWQLPINKFDLRRQNAYARKVLDIASPVMQIVPALNLKPTYKPLPSDINERVELISHYDSQYTLQNEDVDKDSAIYKLRSERNFFAAQVIYPYLKEAKPDLVIVPNGTIQEQGIVYQIARSLKINTVTYEFGDQRQHIWLAKNQEVMQQQTDDLWEAKKDISLSEEQMERLKSLFSARQRASLVENFARLWQDVPAQGALEAKKALQLDERPVVLLATNVLGDSLTLGRQIFSSSMAEWITRTLQYFLGRPDVQLVIRVHPGEVLTHGLSMIDVVKSVSPVLPEYIHIVGAKDKVNTYDLIEVADIGLVYTTTVGMEMALSGVPVIVAGKTHYRGRGFTIDPDNWVTYYKTIGQMLENISKFQMTREKVELAWRYAYRFFFEYPRPFPWHLVRLWDDYHERPLDALLDGKDSDYLDTLNYLTGKPIPWKEI